MNRMLRFAILALVIMVASQSTKADPFTFTATLDPSQEPPPPVRVSSGLGFGTVILDGNLLTVDLSWQNLTAAPVAAHIHCCVPPGVNGPVAVDFADGFPKTPSGTFSDVFDLTDASIYGGVFLASFGGDVDAAATAFTTGLQSGLAYFNIHTPTYPGGEIRGQLTAVPEPATMLLLGTGLAGLGGVIKRRRSRQG